MTTINPKAVEGRRKLNMALVPPSALVHLASAMQDGNKHGPFSWRDAEQVCITDYTAAIKRHLTLYEAGEDIVPDSTLRVHHLAAVMASCAILLDAEAAGVLDDDRPKCGRTIALLEALNEMVGEGR